MNTSDSNCKEGASKSNDDGVCVSDTLQSMSTVDNEVNDTSVCANCGKEGDNINNICNKCKQVKYCNAACKKKHRSKHKKECENHIQRLAELVAKSHDEKLFKQPTPAEDCPICFLHMPSLQTGWRYQSCCGKVICSGCIYAPVYDNQGNEVGRNQKCPFCRTPTPTSIEEAIERLKKRMEIGDVIAIFNLGVFYSDGTRGFSQDYTKALELWHRAAELGYSEGYLGIGNAYLYGRGVEVDEKKARHYYELAAMAGDEAARYNLGLDEWRAGNMERALKHWMIAARDGYSNSLKQVKRLYTHEQATKEDYTRALQLYQTYLGEIKSSQRDEAAAAHDTLRYY